MIKEKKIITEILPRSAPVSQQLVDKIKQQQTDGKVIYEEFTNKGMLFCLNCEHPFSVNETKDARCQMCIRDRDSTVYQCIRASVCKRRGAAAFVAA